MKSFINLPFINELDRALTLRNPLLKVLIGPRQVGKTTSILAYLNERYPNKYHYMSLDSVFSIGPDLILSQWQLAKQEHKILVFDEIQKAENWPELMKKLWDQEQRDVPDPAKRLQCILLGSSSLQIQKGITESLTGRFVLIRAFHWNAQESAKGYALNFEEYLKFGGYPGTYPMIKTNDWAKYLRDSIISTIIEKDILQYQTVKSPSLFKQAFEIISSYPSQEISYTKLLGQLQDKGNTELVKHYLHLYQGAFLIKVLEKFSGKAIKTKSSSPKIVPLAPCLYYLGVLAEYSAEERGRVFEAVVGAQLVRTEFPLYYWREGKYEVDYVLKVGRAIYAIEVKSGRKNRAKGIAEFKDKYPTAQIVVITPDNYLAFESDPMAFLQGQSQS